MRGDFEADTPVWIWQSDRSGAEAETDLLDAARRNWGRMLADARRYEQDSSVAADILEAVLLATSKARKEPRSSGKPIQNLDGYLYVAFVRRFNRYLDKQPKLIYVGTTQDLDVVVGAHTGTKPPTIEDDLFARELLQCMNERARRTCFLRWNVGYSWRETAKLLRTTANSAQVLLNKAVGKARARIMKLKDSKGRPGKGGEGHA